MPERLSNQSEGSSEAGYALIEMLVTLAILSMALAVLWGVLADGTRRAGQAASSADAVLRARSLLDKTGVEIPLRSGLTTGQSADGLRWQVRIAPYGDATQQRAWPVAAFAVDVEVSWHDGGKERALTLSTLRLGPKENLR